MEQQMKEMRLQHEDDPFWWKQQWKILNVIHVGENTTARHRKCGTVTRAHS
jgi:hypothetical protein